MPDFTAGAYWPCLGLIPVRIGAKEGSLWCEWTEAASGGWNFPKW